jgi:CubicO group peptidase (beta-lactamase class C family)
MVTNLRRLLLVTVFAPLSLAAQNAAPASWRPALDRFAEKLRTEVAADNVGSITAGVALGDRLVWANGFGWADRDKKIAATPETVYRIGSISKPFTAVALMLAVQRGQISLDEPVSKYLPEAAQFAGTRPGMKPPTMRQLASHTAGLVREPQLPNAAAGPIGEWENKVLAAIPTTRFDTIPGARYSYSNIGFGVLGLAVSRGSGVPFMKLVTDGIFTPLGMRSSTYIIDDRLRKNLAVGYSNRPGGSIDPSLPAREHDGRGYKVPNGGIYSTVGDLARFAAMMSGQLGDNVLTASSRNEMLRVQTPNNPQSGYGLGFMIAINQNNHREISHGGSVAGYTAHLVFDPDTRISVILLRNYDGGQTNLARAANELLRELVTAGR